MLTLEQIQHRAPSVFAQGAWEGTSSKYQFFPTHHVVQALMDNGFACSSARQARTRIEGKEDFVKHILRFRHDDLRAQALKVGDVFPEIILTNSHDGSSSYNITMGMFRLACSNGMCVKTANIEDIRVRHSGREQLIDSVIEGSFEIIKEAPKVIEQVRDWQAIHMNDDEQRVFAETALELRGTTLEVSPDALLKARRAADRPEVGAGRDLWQTMNVVQESLIRGGAYGRSPTTGQLRRMNEVKSVIEDTKLNRALWQMTEKMAELKTKAA